MDILNKKYSSPLEREYESWITNGIEQYFKSLNKQVAIWAVSPNEEVNWPADEKLIVGRKLIGLQFKKAIYSPKNKPDDDPRTFDRLKWSLHTPKGQFALVRKFSEIFYCLPTFINRDYKEQALNHCIFWRPDLDNKNAWYDNENAKTEFRHLLHQDRWGKFIEQVIRCEYGRVISSVEELKSTVADVHRFIRGDIIRDINHDENSDPELESTQDFCLYMLLVPLD